MLFGKQWRIEKQPCCTSDNNACVCRFSGRRERWRRRSKTNAARTDPRLTFVHFFSLHCFQGQPGVMGVEGQPGLAGYTVSCHCCSCMWRRYGRAKTDDAFTLYCANRGLHVRCRAALIAEASGKVSSAEIRAAAANNDHACKNQNVNIRRSSARETSCGSTVSVWSDDDEWRCQRKLDSSCKPAAALVASITEALSAFFRSTIFVLEIQHQQSNASF